MVQVGRCRTATTGSIAGGFVLVPVASLMAAWRACRSDSLGIADFRAWLACREMVARRCLAEEDRTAVYSFAELARLQGVSPKRARASINRLVLAGLLEWSGQALGFPDPPADFDPGLDDSIGRGRGSLVLPRRVLRFLAAGARPVLIATVLGLLLRCLSRRRNGFDGRGRVKSGWIARVFGVDLRRVKQARRELIELGWIEPEPDGQCAENRWGRAFRIDLAWDRPAPAEGRSLPPLLLAGRPEIATPSANQEPFQERTQHQEPASGGHAGIRLSDSEGGMEPPVASHSPAAASAARAPVSSRAIATRTPGGPATASPRVPPPARPATPPPPSPAVPGPGLADGDWPAPRLDDVRVEDLKDTARLLELHGQAVARGIVGASEADRLRVVSAAEHARAIGKANPAGLFCYLLRGGPWRYITQADEDRAHARIKAHLAVPASARPTIGLPVLGGASRRSPEDAEVVRSVRAAVIRAGIYRDPFPEFVRLNPGWSRERWERALAAKGGP